MSVKRIPKHSQTPPTTPTAPADKTRSTGAGAGAAQNTAQNDATVGQSARSQSTRAAELTSQRNTFERHTPSTSQARSAASTSTSSLAHQYQGLGGLNLGGRSTASGAQPTTVRQAEINGLTRAQSPRGHTHTEGAHGHEHVGGAHGHAHSDQVGGEENFEIPEHSHAHDHGAGRSEADQEARAERSGREGEVNSRVSDDNDRHHYVEFGSENNDITVSQNDEGNLVMRDATSGDSVELDPSDLDRIMVRGQGGDDTIRIDESVSAENAGKIRMSGGEGDDTLIGSAHGETIFGGSGEDTIRAGGGADEVYGGTGDDTLEGGTGRDEIHGQDGDDTIRGGGARDEIEGGEGDDTIYGGAGGDRIRGGEGDDTISGGTGGDYIRGDAGDDTLRGYSGNDRIMGGDGDDTIEGGTGEDLLAGQAGDDTVRGGADRDVITGGSGDDIVDGYQGDHGGTHDVVAGNQGHDTTMTNPGDTVGRPNQLDVSTDEQGNTVVTLNRENNNATISQDEDGRISIDVDGETTTLNQLASRSLIIRGGAGDDTIQLDDSVTSDVRIEGGAGNDTLIGNDNANTLIGGRGEDTIRGGGGSDYLEGGYGNDNIDGGAGNDSIYGLDGEDTIDAGEGRDYVDGGRGEDAIAGGAGNDILIGGRGDDTITGGDGDDVIAGGHGTDNIDAGQGADQLYTQSNDNVANDADGNTVEEVDLSTTNDAGNELGTSISVDSSNPEFAARVQSDIDAMRSLPAGRRMLRELDNSGHSTTIMSTDEGIHDGNAANATDRSNVWLNSDGTANTGSDARVYYNTARDRLGGGDPWSERPPLVGLYHELSHAHNYTHGTLQRGSTTYNAPDGSEETDSNRELAATGLPYDHDQNSDTPNITSTQPTENDLREQLGLPRREAY